MEWFLSGLYGKIITWIRHCFKIGLFSVLTYYVIYIYQLIETASIFISDVSFSFNQLQHCLWHHSFPLFISWWVYSNYFRLIFFLINFIISKNNLSINSLYNHFFLILFLRINFQYACLLLYCTWINLCIYLCWKRVLSLVAVLTTLFRCCNYNDLLMGGMYLSHFELDVLTIEINWNKV